MRLGRGASCLVASLVVVFFNYPAPARQPAASPRSSPPAGHLPTLLCALRRRKHESRGIDLRRIVPVSELDRRLGCATDRLGRYDISGRQRFFPCHHPQLSVYIRAAEGKSMHLDAVDEGHSDMGAAGDGDRRPGQSLWQTHRRRAEFAPQMPATEREERYAGWRRAVTGVLATVT
jgi:hypothetical protein